MKKKVTILTVLLISFLNVIAQTNSGIWNSKTATYTNEKYHVKWSLPNELTWIGRPIIVENTKFKVRNDDTNILVSLNIFSNSGPICDILEYENEIKEGIISKAKMTAGMHDMQYRWAKCDRKKIRGINALRTIFDISKYYPETNSTFHSIEYSYHIIYKNFVYSINVLAISINETDIKDFYPIAEYIIDGFNFK